MPFYKIYHLLSVIIFAVVSFIDIYGLLTILIPKVKSTKDLRLGISVVVTIAWTFIVIHDIDIVAGDYFMLTYAILSGALIAYVFGVKSFNISQIERGYKSGFFTHKNIFGILISITISVAFLIIWQWIAVKLVLTPF